MDNAPSIAAQIILTIVPIVGIIFGCTILFFYLYYGHRAKMLMIEKGTYQRPIEKFDLDSFSLFARDVLLNLPNVKDVHTSFSLGEVKADGALPLDAAGA